VRNKEKGFVNAASNVDVIKLFSLSLMVGQNKLEWYVFLAFLILQIRLQRFPCLEGRLLALPANFETKFGNLVETNTLAYFALPFPTKKKVKKI
jgi:hypothetical protein